VAFARVRLSGWSLLRIFFDGFGEKVVPVLVKHNLGVLGMKPLAEGAIPKSKSATAVECLQYATSLPTSAVITGCDSMQVLQQAFGAARNLSLWDASKWRPYWPRQPRLRRMGNMSATKHRTILTGRTITRSGWDNTKGLLRHAASSPST
jgi:hypothetical protein